VLFLLFGWRIFLRKLADRYWTTESNVKVLIILGSAICTSYDESVPPSDRHVPQWYGVHDIESDSALRQRRSSVIDSSQLRRSITAEKDIVIVTRRFAFAPDLPTPATPQCPRTGQVSPPICPTRSS
jgi:hypothetical protein